MTNEILVKTNWDVFLSYASEDKVTIAIPLFNLLTLKGIRVWLDDDQILLGNSIRREVEKGLIASKYGVVIISKSYLAKEWTQKELDCLLHFETVAKHAILPIWYDVNHEDLERVPFLLDRKAIKFDGDIGNIVSEIVKLIESNESSGLYHHNTNEHTNVSNRNKQIAQSLYDLLIKPDNIAYGKSSAKILDGLNILIVDDEPVTREVLKEIYESCGARAFVAENGVKALTILRQQKTDIVISDVVMPVMGGAELVKTIHREYPFIPTILMSGCLSVNDEIFTSLPFEFFIKKPCDDEEYIKPVYDICFSNGLYAFIKNSFPNSLKSYWFLQRSHDIAISFIDAYSSDNFFEVAIRHKLKGCINVFCANVSKNGTVSINESQRLYKLLSRLFTMMSQIKHGANSGFIKILKGIKDDQKKCHPGIKISLNLESRLPANILSGDIGTFLAFSAIELIDNAIDAIDKNGHIWISLTKMISKKQIVLSVSDDGPKIPEGIASRIFVEGITTKGDGRGMGLHIIKTLADRFNCQIVLDMGDEVLFSILIPIQN